MSRELADAELVEIQRTFVVDAMHDAVSAKNLLLELTPDDFTDGAARDGYEAVRAVVQGSDTVDLLAVRSHLLACGKRESTAALMGHLASSGRAYIQGGHYQALLAPLRKDTLIRKARVALNHGLHLLDGYEAGELDQEVIQGDIVRRLGQAFSRGKQIRGVYETEALASLAARLEREELARLEGETPISRYLPFGFTELDRIAKGGGDGELIVVGARPKMGKSAFAISVSRSWERHSSGDILFFTKEMTVMEQAERIAAQELSRPVDSISSIDVRNIMRPHKRLCILDYPFRNVSEVCQHVRRHSLMYKVSGICLDYLQRYCREDRQEVSDASKALKDLAMELECPVMMLSQLSRKCEDRNDRRPLESDLRESGSIEQDANKILLLFRPGIYPDVPMYRNTDPAEADITLSKQRNGAGNSGLRIPFRFYGSTYTWTEYHGMASPATFPCRDVPMEDVGDLF